MALRGRNLLFRPRPSHDDGGDRDDDYSSSSSGGYGDRDGD